MLTEVPISKNQKTLKNNFSFTGIGLHTGEYSNVTVSPSLEDSGIVFIRTDKDKDNNINALWSNVTSTRLCTTIANSSGTSVSTIEHLMSALSGMHIDNVIIKINGPEVPIMDGSAEPFVRLIESVGIKNQKKYRKCIRVLKDVVVESGDSYAYLKPNLQFSIDFEIDFPSSVIDKQSCQIQMINGNYKEDVSKARTFGFEDEVENLRNKGFALGGSLSNAVVVSKDKILNKEGLRYEDEFVRHKILDSIGDLYLAGAPVIGYFKGMKSGHSLNNELLKKLLSDQANWTYS